MHYSEEAEALAKRLKLRFYRASVKEDLNVNEGELLEMWTAGLVQMKQSNSELRKKILSVLSFSF